jgi:hypothetical protein
MPSIKRQIKLDKICGETRSVLCVNSVLTIIATSATNIERLANDIEQHILNKSHIVGRLNALVNSEMNSIRAHLPVSKYHGILPNLSNIDKVDFFCIFFFEITFYLFIGISRSFTQGGTLCFELLLQLHR